MAGRGLAKQKINWKKKFRTIQPQDSSRENLVDVSFFFLFFLIHSGKNQKWLALKCMRKISAKVLESLELIYNHVKEKSGREGWGANLVTHVA